MAEPVLKWAGGKASMIDTIEGYIPDDYDKYHEPLIGGGAVFFHLEPKGGTIGDTNKRLCNFYVHVQDRPRELIANLKQFHDPDDSPTLTKRYAGVNRKGKQIKNCYYQERELFNRRPNGEGFRPIDEAAQLMYLNRTCFNGLYRENQSGEFNVPIGSYADPEWVFEDRIMAAHKVLQGTDILSRDFEYVIERASENDLVYLDPPYEPMPSTESFTDYTSDGFDKAEQNRLISVCEKLDEMGVHVVASNSAIMESKYLDIGFTVDKVVNSRSISSDGATRGSVDEIIATNNKQ